MKAKRYTTAEILEILEQHRSGMPAKEIIEKYRIANGTFYRWRSKYTPGNTLTAEKNSTSSTIYQLSLENRRLKSALADTMLQKIALEEQLEDSN